MNLLWVLSHVLVGAMIQKTIDIITVGKSGSAAVDQECMRSYASSCSFYRSFLIRLYFFAGTGLMPGQRIGRSNGKRNWIVELSFTKNTGITTLAAVVEVLLLITTLRYFNSKQARILCTTRCQNISTKMYLAYRVRPKKCLSIHETHDSPSHSFSELP